MSNIHGWTMATYSPRQQQILENLGRNMGFALEEVTAVNYESDIPVGVTYRNTSGTFTRQTYDQLGSILTNVERDQIRQTRFDEKSTLSTAFLASQALQGYNYQPRASDFAYSNGRTSTTGAITQIARNFDPKSARLIAAGLGAFGDTQLTNASGQVVSFTGTNQEDRVRISDPSNIFINANNPILRPLAEVGYVLFPYTPTISINHSASYEPVNPTHSNYTYNFYQHSTTATISITAQFTAKDPNSAAYVLAVQHFFRSVTKMFYGKDPEAGTPPPVLRLDGYGDYQFSSVPVVITDFGVTLPTDVDYISTGSGTTGRVGNFGFLDENLGGPGISSSTKVPVMQEFSITCMPVYSRKSISNDFGLREFAAGKLLGKKGGRGGFI